MGGAQSTHYPVKARLIFADTSLHNNEVICQEYGVRYHIRRPSGAFSFNKMTVVSRSDPAHPTGPYIVAQWEQNTWSKDRLQVALNGPDFAPVNQVFPDISNVLGRRWDYDHDLIICALSDSHIQEKVVRSMWTEVHLGLAQHLTSGMS